MKDINNIEFVKQSAIIEKWILLPMLKSRINETSPLLYAIKTAWIKGSKLKDF